MRASEILEKRSGDLIAVEPETSLREAAALQEQIRAQHGEDADAGDAPMDGFYTSKNE